MGLRFRKSVKIGKHAKINFNKNSVGFTVGTKGAHFTVNSKGRKTTTVGIPGTGVSYSHTSGGKKKKSTTTASSRSKTYTSTSHESQPILKPGVSYGNPSQYKRNANIYIGAAALFALIAFMISSTRIIFGVLAAICVLLAWGQRKIYTALLERDKEWQQPSTASVFTETSVASTASGFDFPKTDKNGKPILQLITLEVHGIMHEHGETDPQAVLPTLSEHEQLILIPDTENEHDPYAVRVLTIDSQQIGWLPAGNKDIFERLIENREVYARIKRVYERSWYDDQTVMTADIEIARYRR